MATGIHSRLQTGRTPTRPPAPRLIELPKRAWLALSPRKRIGLVAAVLLTLGAVLMTLQVRAASEPSELYQFALSPVELRDMSRELAAVGIAHDINVQGDNLLVEPSKQEQARLYLRDKGLPRSRPEVRRREPSAMQPETDAERLAALQEDLRVNLRQLEGVADASVQIALPPPSYFTGDDKHATACVKLEMQNGHTLTAAQVNGVTAMVSASVNDLAPEDVQIVDQTGRLLTQKNETVEQDMLSSLQATLELNLTQKAQAMVDHCFGPGHGFAQVTVTMDNSEIEIRKKGTDPNSYVVLQRRTEKEEYGSGSPDDVGAQMSAEPGGSRSYRKICEITKGVANESYYVKVERMPRIARVSCAVALDRSAEAERVRELIKGAIGMDESRGDFLTVQSIAPPMLAAQESPAPVVPAQAPSQFSGLALGAGFLLAGIAALFAAGMAPRRFATHTQMAVRSGPADIRDLVGSTIVDETSLRSTQRIEDYCRQVPNRAATTLKELWLQ